MLTPLVSTLLYVIKSYEFQDTCIYETNQVLLKYCFLTGAIVILLQRLQADFKVLGVGKVASLQGTQAPDDHAPVYVVLGESCATCHVGPVYTPSTTEQGQHSRNVVSSIPSGSQDDRLFNYNLG